MCPVFLGSTWARSGCSPRRITAALAIVVVMGIATACAGQSGATPPLQSAPPVVQPVAEPLTLELIETRRKEAEDSKDLDDETKKKVAEWYRLASEQLTRAAELAAQEVDFRKRAETVPERVQQIKRQIDLLNAEPEPQAPAAATLSELEQELAKQVLLVTERKNAAAQAESEPKTRPERRQKIRELLLSGPERLAEVTKQLAAPAPADEKPLVILARRTELLTRHQVIQREVPALQAELALYDAGEAVDLPRLQRDVCALEVVVAEKRAKFLDDLVKAKRAQAAQDAVRKAREELIAAEPSLKPFAERNQVLAEAAQTLAQKLAAADKDLNAVKKDLDDVKKRFTQAQERVKSIGLTGAIGLMLRNEKSKLPDIAKLRANVRNRSPEIDQAQYELFDYDERRSGLADTDAMVDEMIRKTPPAAVARDQFEQAARDLIDRKREYLDSLIRNYRAYFYTLVELDTTERELIRQGTKYSQFIDERVLWIRTGESLHAQLRLDDSDRWLVSPSRWGELLAKLGADIRENFAMFACALLPFLVLFRFQLTFRKELREISTVVQSGTCQQFAPTLRALFLTVMISLPWPALLAYFGWRLDQIALAWRLKETPIPDGVIFAAAVGRGMLLVAGSWASLAVLRQMCRPLGLAQSHFGWLLSATKSLRRNLHWLMLSGLPLLFIVSTLYDIDSQHGFDALERVCFILATIAFALFLRRVLRPTGGVFQQYVAYHQGGWLDRLKSVWYWLGVLSPLSLAALSYAGFYYTAIQLSWRLFVTLGLVVLLVVLRSFLLRLVLVQRRRLAIVQARERRAAALAAQEGESAEGTSQAPLIAPQVPEDLDLASTSRQTERLLGVTLVSVALAGVWMIWVDVLPALHMLDRWPLWTTTVQVSQEITDASGTPTQRNVDQIKKITMAHLAFAVFVAVVTIVAARNLPGMLEMSVLQRLPIDAAVRYAITTLASYGIVLVGLIVAFGIVGIGWAQVQWLAAALTFGLAFGLQEIFANFVAGLILFFERPIRIGDVVTVDDVTGTVTRIRIRATTITNWDRKEFLVPNREFITGRVLNWTLSDKINRIVINLGIAYGSDTKLATELLLKVVNEHPLILKDPQTRVTFEGFGDSTLNLTVRTYLPNLDDRLQVVHDLHTAIDQAFRDAGIEIAFPQQDLHIRSVPDTAV